MRKRLNIFIYFIIITYILAACTPSTPEVPTEHTTPAFGIHTTSQEESSEESTEESSAESSSEALEESSPCIEETTEKSTEETTEESMEETTEESTEEPSITETLSFTEVEEIVTVTDSVNVRKGHSTSSEILAVATRGQTLTRIGYNEEWSKVIYLDQECYISSAYLTTETLPPETTAPPETEPVQTHPITGFHSHYWNNLSNVTLSGRWFVKNFGQYEAFTTLNAGSEFDFQISGTGYFTLYFAHTVPGNYYFSYSIDGQPPVRQPISNPTVSISEGTHTVRVIVDSLNDTGSRWDESSHFAIAGIDIGHGTISPWQYSGKIIGFYGDSITEGINTLGKGGHSYTNSYTWYYCQYTGAMPVVCGFPGSGATTTGVFNTSTIAVQYLSSGRAATDYTPSIIIVNHGTNDMYVDSATFINGYNQLLDTLHSKFPNTQIACMIPLGQYHADDIRYCVAERAWCKIVETEGWEVSYTDGLHPDAVSASTIAMNLKTAIQQLFGQ